MFLLQNILSLIPQRPPMVMIDKLLYSDQRLTRSGFHVTNDNIFVQNGFFREPGLVENIAQTAAARAGYMASQENTPVKVGYIAAVKNLEIFSLPKVDDELITEITIDNIVFDVNILSGHVWCNSVLLAQCEMKIFT